MKLLGYEIQKQKRSTTESTTSTSTASTTTAAVNLNTLGLDYVTGDSLSMKVSTVFRCVDILSKEIALLPLGLYKRMSEGHFVLDPYTFGLTYPLSQRSNDRQTAFELLRSAIGQCLLRGNAYIVWDESENLDITAFYLVSPGACVYDKYSNTYRIADPINHINGVYESDKVIHLKNIGLDGGFTGVSTLAYAGQCLAISYNADTQNVQTFKNGGLVSGFVTGKNNATVGFGQVQDAQLNTVATRIDTELASGKKIINLPGEMDFKQWSLSPSDIQLLETKEFNVFEICRFFGVHPDKVYAQQGGNYKASEMSSVAFLTDTLLPWITMIEEEFTTKLIPRSMYTDWKIKFDLEPLMTTDLGTQADYMTKTIAAGVRTVNDWRIKSGMAPVEGGDKALISTNLAEIGSKKLTGE